MKNNDTGNFDPHSVAHFAQYADDWWNTDGAFRTLHDINPARLAYLQKHVDCAGKRVLDVGCGGGLFAEGLAKSGAEVTGLDLHPENIRCAREHAEENGVPIEYLHTSTTELLTTSIEPFAIVSCLELLEHVPNPYALIQECTALLAEDGVALFSTLNRTLLAWLGAVVVAEDVAHWLPAGSHEYRQFIRPSELATWCRASGLLVEDVCGMQYLPWQRSARLGGAVQINYLLLARKSG